MTVGSVTTRIQDVSNSNYDKICASFIAFDVETTGLDRENDVIIEVAAVKFENGIPVSSYSTLINEGRAVPYAASQVNNITTKMLKKYGKTPVSAYRELVDFLGDALQGETYLCAHNASFDMAFLTRALDRNGYNGNIRCVDTLDLSRELVNMGHHKLSDDARHFHISNKDEHRATGDAETCGRVLVCLLPLKKKRIDKELKEKEKARAAKAKAAGKKSVSAPVLTDAEKITAAIIINGLRQNGCETKNLRLYKRPNGYVELVDEYPHIRFKITKTMAYILHPKTITVDGAVIKDCSISEGTDNVRLMFKDPKELVPRDKLLAQIYRDARNKRYDSANIKTANSYANIKLETLSESEIAMAVTNNGGHYLPLNTAQHIQYDNAEQAGYDFERGRQRAQDEQKAQQNRQQQATMPSSQQVTANTKKSKGCVGSCCMIFLWLCFFPIMLTIWLWKTDLISNKKVKYGLIAALWVLCIIIWICSDKSSADNASSADQATVASTESIVEKIPAADTGAGEDLPVIYEYNDTINRYLNAYNDVNDEPITSDDFNVYHHHGSDHEDQIKFHNVDASMSASGNSLRVVYSRDSDEESKEAFFCYARAFDASLDDAALEDYWSQVMDDSNNDVEFEEFEVNVSIFEDKIELVVMDGTVN